MANYKLIIVMPVGCIELPFDLNHKHFTTEQATQHFEQTLVPTLGGSFCYLENTAVRTQAEEATLDQLTADCTDPNQ